MLGRLLDLGVWQRIREMWFLLPVQGGQTPGKPDNLINGVTKYDEHCERSSRRVLWEYTAEGLGVVEDPSEATSGVNGWPGVWKSEPGIFEVDWNGARWCGWRRGRSLA